MKKLRAAEDGKESREAVKAAAVFLSDEVRGQRDPTGAYVRVLASNAIGGDAATRRGAFLSVLTCGRSPVAESDAGTRAAAADALDAAVSEARRACSGGMTRAAATQAAASRLGDALVDAVLAQQPPGLHAEALWALDRHWRSGRLPLAADSGIRAALAVLDRPENADPVASLDAAIRRVVTSNGDGDLPTDGDVARLRGAAQAVVDAGSDPSGRAALAVAALDGDEEDLKCLALALRLLVPSTARTAQDVEGLRAVMKVLRRSRVGADERAAKTAAARFLRGEAVAGRDPTGAYASAMRAWDAAQGPEGERAALLSAVVGACPAVLDVPPGAPAFAATALRDAVAAARVAAESPECEAAALNLGDALVDALTAPSRPREVYARAMAAMDAAWRPGDRPGQTGGAILSALAVLDRADAEQAPPEQGRSTAIAWVRVGERLRTMKGEKSMAHAAAAITNLRAAEGAGVEEAVIEACACMQRVVDAGCDATGAYAAALESARETATPDLARCAIVGALAARGALPDGQPGQARSDRPAEAEPDGRRPAPGIDAAVARVRSAAARLRSARGPDDVERELVKTRSRLTSEVDAGNDWLGAFAAALSAADAAEDPEQARSAILGALSPRMRLLRASMAAGRMEEADAARADHLTTLGYRPRTTVVTPDGLWAVVTMVLEGALP